VRSNPSIISMTTPAAILMVSAITSGGWAQPPGVQRGGPPPEAAEACDGSRSGDPCFFESPHGTVRGVCRNIGRQLACVPAKHRQGRDAPPGRRSSGESRRLLDVRGAGAQRSDPKCGDLRRYAGGAHWRLPDAKELHSIVDYGRPPSAKGYMSRRSH
jgi:hypothetical protein